MLPYFRQEVEATILVICLCIATKFKEYQMMSSMLGPLSKNKEPETPRLTNAEILASAATTADGTGANGTSGRGGYGGSRGGTGRDRRKWPVHTANDNTGERPPGKKRIG